MLTISPSKIGAYECPFYFQNQYLVDDPGARKSEGPDTPLPLLVGRFAHAVVDLYSKALKQSGIPSDFGIYNTIFEELRRQIPWIPDSEYETLKGDLMPFAESFRIDPQALWATEKKIALTWDGEETEWGAENAHLRVVLDRVDVFPGDATALCVDYKTQRYIPSETKLRKSLQTKLYPYALWKVNPFLERFIVRYWYVRWNKYVDIELSSLMGLENDFEKIEREIKAFSERVQSKIDDPNSEWPPIRGESCGICRYDCPLIALGIEPIRSVEKAQEVAMQVEALKAKAKELGTQLQNYVKASDARIEVHSGFYSYRPMEVLKGIKPHHIIDYGQEKGIPVDDLPLKFDSDAFKKTAGPEMKEAIRSIGKVTTQSRFSFTKTATTGEEDDE